MQNPISNFFKEENYKQKPKLKVFKNKEEVEKKVKKIIEHQMGISLEKIHLDDRFIQDLKTDSLDTVELVLSLEKAFKVSISDEEAESMLKVKDAVEKVCTLLEIKQ